MLHHTSKPSKIIALKPLARTDGVRFDRSLYPRLARALGVVGLEVVEPQPAAATAPNAMAGL